MNALLNSQLCHVVQNCIGRRISQWTIQSAWVGFYCKQLLQLLLAFLDLSSIPLQLCSPYRPNPAKPYIYTRNFWFSFRTLPRIYFASSSLPFALSPDRRRSPVCSRCRTTSSRRTGAGGASPALAPASAPAPHCPMAPDLGGRPPVPRRRRPRVSRLHRRLSRISRPRRGWCTGAEPSPAVAAPLDERLLVPSPERLPTCVADRPSLRLPVTGSSLPHLLWIWVPPKVEQPAFFFWGVLRHRIWRRAFHGIHWCGRRVVALMPCLFFLRPLSSLHLVPIFFFMSIQVQNPCQCFLLHDFALGVAGLILVGSGWQHRRIDPVVRWLVPGLQHLLRCIFRLLISVLLIFSLSVAAVCVRISIRCFVCSSRYHPSHSLRFPLHLYFLLVLRLSTKMTLAGKQGSCKILRLSTKMSFSLPIPYQV
jgi:hypothetical protein